MSPVDHTDQPDTMWDTTQGHENQEMGFIGHRVRGYLSHHHRRISPGTVMSALLRYALAEASQMKNQLHEGGIWCYYPLPQSASSLKSTPTQKWVMSHSHGGAKSTCKALGGGSTEFMDPSLSQDWEIKPSHENNNDNNMETCNFLIVRL